MLYYQGRQFNDYQFWVDNQHLASEDITVDGKGEFYKKLNFSIEGLHSMKVRQKFNSKLSAFAELSPVVVHLRVPGRNTSNNLSGEAVSAKEDSALKIERCRIEANIIARNDRYKEAVANDLLRCYTNPSCNYQNTEIFTKAIEESSRKESYESNYARCLTASREEFEKMNKQIESFWDKCENEQVGEQGITLYNKRMKCVMFYLGA